MDTAELSNLIVVSLVPSRDLVGVQNGAEIDTDSQLVISEKYRQDINYDQNQTVALIQSGDSSVGRAVDCRSIGRVFDSHSPEIWSKLGEQSLGRS